MGSNSQSVRAKVTAEGTARTAAAAGPLIARMRDVLLGRLRKIAWHALDLHTDFEVLD